MHTMLGLRFFATLAHRGEAIPDYLLEPGERQAAPADVLDAGA